MNNLVIGNTSQLSNFFPDEYIKISSKDIDFNTIKKTKWNRVFLCFGESRKFIETNELYNEINFNLTIKVINELKNISEKIIIYSTCELWNKFCGPITLNDRFNFFSTPYLNSKFKLVNYINNNRNSYQNVIIIYPFNFNSPIRKSDFLFGKIFDSIINKKSITIGDTYFYRDIIHPKFLVNKSITANSDIIVGSGRLTYLNDLIKDLYNNFGLNYDEYVSEDRTLFNEYEKRNEYYLRVKNCEFTYKDLVNETINDLKKEMYK